MAYLEVEREIRQKYYAHKWGAKKRGIEFTLSFEQWWELWAPHWHRRGRKVDDMQMCRTRDEGGYTIGNVRIDTQRANAQERGVSTKVRHAPRFTRADRRASGITAMWLSERRPFDEYSEEDA